MLWPLLTRQRHHQHDLVASSLDQATPSRLLEQDDDPILDVARGWVGFKRIIVHLV
jgi:hypothetical protein